MPTAHSRQLGQFFTRSADVQRVMTALVEHRTGAALEPSAGEGHLAGALLAARPGLSLTSVELDGALPWSVPTPRLTEDFFTFAQGRDGSFDVVFGNPPYVAWKAMRPETQTAAESLAGSYHSKVNLYQLFIHRCVDLLAPGGELVFIVPGEWTFSTAAAPLRRKLQAEGSITHFIHCGEEKLFSDASVPFICILRFQKGARQKKVSWWGSFTTASTGDKAEKRTLVMDDSRWMLLPHPTAQAVASWGRLSDQFDVKVGLVSGADDVFRLKDGSKVEPECRLAQVTSERECVEFLFLDRFDALSDVPRHARAYVRRHRSRLISRRIRRFDGTNYWQYGAVRNLSAMDSQSDRFFALVKTRSPEPFFSVPGGTHFTGAVLGIFPRPGAAISCSDAIRLLNSAQYRRVFEGLFVVSGDKISLQPATLMDAPFPRSVDDLDEFLA